MDKDILRLKSTLDQTRSEVRAFVVGTQGFKPFVALGWFIVAVLLALALQSIYYLTQVKLWSWVPPTRSTWGQRTSIWAS